MIWPDAVISLGRDPVSMLTHLAGAACSLIGTLVLVRHARRSGLRGIGVGVYGLMMVLTFSCSALFHYIDASSPHFQFFNKLDHSAIFFMIAGTGTAIYGSIQAGWAPVLTAMLWTVAIGGSTLQLFLWPLPDGLSAFLYVTIGWLGSVGVLAIGHRSRWRKIHSFLIGAAVFSAAAVVYAVEWPSLWGGRIDSHAVFHVLVLLGAAFHAEFVYRHCTCYTLAQALRSYAPAPPTALRSISVSLRPVTESRWLRREWVADEFESRRTRADASEDRIARKITPLDWRPNHQPPSRNSMSSSDPRSPGG